MVCEICERECDEGFDAQELAKTIGMRRRDDFGRFVICRDCYARIERAMSVAWLSKVRTGDPVNRHLSITQVSTDSNTPLTETSTL